MFSKNHASAFVIGTAIASTFAAGCVAESSAEDDPVAEVTTSSLSSTALVSMIAINLGTGGDDKRSDSRVWVQIGLNNGGHSPLQEVGAGVTWYDWRESGWNYISLPSGTRNQDIRDVKISWQQGGGGWNGDNWNLQSLSIYALDSTNGQWSLQPGPAGNPLLRFTGSDKEFAWVWIQ